MTPHRIAAVGVLVPAHDEAATIGACVRSVLTALDTVAGTVAAALCVLADRCTDGTATLARDAAAAHPAASRVRVAVVESAATLGALPGARPEPGAAPGGAPPTVGAVRHRAARTALELLADSGVPAGRTWLLSTDADGTVAPDWVSAHLSAATAGADAVAGGVLLDLPGTPVPPGEPGWPDHPVYGANLGVRADAYLGVGGFPPVACGEDHGLIARLRSAGHTVVPGAPSVLTSARTAGRAGGGLADLLRSTAAGVGTAGAGRPVA